MDKKDSPSSASIPWTSGQVDDPTKEYWNVILDDFVIYSDTELKMTCILDKKYVSGLLDQVPKNSKTSIQKVALLQTLYIPEALRRKKRATAIVEQLEQRANKELGLPLAIGPIIDETDAMTKLVTRRKYVACPPFSWLQQGSF